MNNNDLSFGSVLKICFIVSSLEYGGPYRVVSCLSEELEKNGNDVNVLCSVPNHSFFKLKYAINNLTLFKRCYIYVASLVKMLLIEVFGRFVYKEKLSKMYKVNSDYFTLLKRPKLDSDTVYIFSNNWYQFYEFNEYFLENNNSYLILHHPEYEHLKSDYKGWVDSVYKNNDINKITVSDATKKEFDDLGFKINTILTLGVDHTIFNNNLNINNNVIHILLYYSLTPRKNGVNGLKALEKIKSKYSNLKFSIISDHTDDFPDWYDAYSSLSDQELSELYQSVDIFIYPSLYEGFGLPPLEAMACSTAVIASNTGEAKKYALHRDNVMLINKGGSSEIALLANELISDNTLLNKLKKNGQLISEKYTWSNSANHFESELIGNFKNKNINFDSK